MATTIRYESQNVSAEPLSRSLHFEFSGKTAPNRFLKAAMVENLASWDPKSLVLRGIPSEEYINLYRRWGEGEFGTIVTGNIMIELDQLVAEGCAVIPRGSEFEGQRFEAYKALANAGKQHGAIFLAQVCHPGRQVPSSIRRSPISASDIQLKRTIWGKTFEKPRAATTEDIEQIIDGFAHAAEYLHKAGFDGIQLHAAHGFLLAQFLSPSTNKRTDKYGGNLENRSRIIIEITQSIRERVPSSFSISIKINSVEFQDQGFDTTECRDLCASLEANRFDFVELSGGTYEELAFNHRRDSTRKREAFFLEFAKAIVPALSKTKTFVTGGFKTVGAMVHALQTVDGVGLARIVCQEPRFCADALSGRLTGAIKQRMDEDDFGLTYTAGGSLMMMIGKDLEPVDLSREEVERGFMKDMDAWAEGMANDTENCRYKYAEIESVKINPYGVAY